jgi:hypothetical protein
MCVVVSTREEPKARGLTMIPRLSREADLTHDGRFSSDAVTARFSKSVHLNDFRRL